MKLDAALLEALRSSGHESIERHTDGSIWGSVYLDNFRPANCTPRQFAQKLSMLKKAGLYHDEDNRDYKGIWGHVKLEQQP